MQRRTLLSVPGRRRCQHRRPLGQRPGRLPPTSSSAGWCPTRQAAAPTCWRAPWPRPCARRWASKSWWTTAPAPPPTSAARLWPPPRPTATPSCRPTTPSWPTTSTCSASCPSARRTISLYVGGISRFPLALVVHPSFEAKTMKEFLAYVRQPRQGQLRLAGQRLAAPPGHGDVQEPHQNLPHAHPPTAALPRPWPT